ncbi:type III polyketide synthase [Bacillus cihuensis]|uniref:type III polyketide synthase n=1 Tax=Bacillus cihuensis TaxID=1208599 RepID=UPI000407251C|nr:3-oxoacyl-[acyl-carrier-protein] synthase III C-terminal domain-containing protein [Bacillus cihuensis]
MPYILSTSHIQLPYLFAQEKLMEFSREIFGSSFKDIDRLLRAFKNGQVDSRYFIKDLEWFKRDHSFEERNNAFIEGAVTYGTKAIQSCLSNGTFLKHEVAVQEIEAIFFVTSSGIATPTIDARIMNRLPFSPYTKRIPLWGLGCAGGASGLSRAFEYCKAFPKAKVLVLSVELCSLSFQRNDRSKSNLIGTSLFSDGVACTFICGDEVARKSISKVKRVPKILSTQSTLMPDSLDVMGWDVRNEGLHVIFSKDIPTIISNWLKPNVEVFLDKNDMKQSNIRHFIAHPGGKKVIDAYCESLGFHEEMVKISMEVLREYGNMSSATILYVLEKFMEQDISEGEYGLAAALGPGFSSELLLLRWEE